MEAAAPGDSTDLRGEFAFRLLVEAVQDYAIFLLGPDGRVVSWNRGAERIKGYSADEIVGKHFSVFYTPEDRANRKPERILRTAAERGRVEDEGWRVRRDGTRFWADVIVTALLDQDGVPFGFAKVTRDLTERRAAEEQRRTLFAEQQARVAAEEAISVRDRFLSIAAHELKTPVASLQLIAQSLMRARDADRLDLERLDTGLRRVETATRRLSNLVDELLDVSRLTSDRFELHLTRSDLVSLVREVVERFNDETQPARIHLEAPATAWIDADLARLDQVVSNLVDNALKYSEAPAPIEVEVRETGDEIVMTVTDRGIGIDSQAADRLFEAFGRGHNARHYQGLGLGLFISHQIVELHGGRIEVRPRDDGRGTVSTVRLPRSGDATQPMPPATASA
jgi:PAS domain S-box-containing protein